jgi:type III secretion protein Q
VDAGLARLKAQIGMGLCAELKAGAVPLRLEVTGAGPASSAQARQRVWLQTPAGPIGLAPAREVIRALTAIDLPDDADADPLRALRLDLAAQAMPQGWFELFGASTLLSGPQDEAGAVEAKLTLTEPDARRGLSVSLQGSGEALQQALSGAAWQRLRARTSSLPHDWKLRVPVVFGRAEVSAAACRALAPGDMVLVSEPHFGLDGEGELRIGSRTAACALRLGNQVLLELTEWHATTTGSTMHDATTGYSSYDGNDHDGGDVGALDGVPVMLTFELGALELSLSELQALGPGSVVPIAGALPPEVAVCAGGRRIGTGEIVELDGRLAVEIRRIGASS